MVMRVTQQSIYGNIISHNNASLSKLISTNLQSSTQKRINAPSDDPVGAVQVLGTRTDISQLTQYQRNITSAKGWLTQTDSTLTSVSTLITSIKGYAEQGATGTVTKENRGEICSAVRQYFQQLISLANTTYNDRSLFAGQKTDTEAFAQTLWMHSNDRAFDAAVASNGGFSIAGGSDTAVLVQFTGTDPATHRPAFRYSSDGGTTWTTGSYAATAPSGTAQRLQLGNGLTVDVPDAALDAVTPSATTEDANGTWMWIRPSAVYQGNAKDSVTARPIGTSVVDAAADGTFAGNVMVRADSNSSFAAGSTFGYSYSLDGGTTWVTGNTSGVADGDSVTLAVPGGILTLSSNGGGIVAGNQFFIQPATADITIAISPTDSVVVNGVGKDIFGGIYNGQAVAFSGSNAGNLFETVGKLIGYLETNNQQGCQEALEALTASQNRILTVAASVGARENRVTAAGTMVQTLKENSTTTLSNVEDADLTELITRLAEQELAYQAVLKSSSTVMNLSLVSYI